MGYSLTQVLVLVYELGRYLARMIEEDVPWEMTVGEQLVDETQHGRVSSLLMQTEKKHGRGSTTRSSTFSNQMA